MTPDFHISEPPSTPDALQDRRERLLKEIQIHEHQFRELYEQRVKAAYAEAPANQTEEQMEDWVLESIHADVSRFQEESEEKLRPLKDELGRIEEEMGEEGTPQEPDMLLPPEVPTPSEEEITQETGDAQEEPEPPQALAGTEEITKRGSKKKLKEQGGLLVVRSLEDIENLTRVKLLSVGILSDETSEQQREEISRLAWEYAEGRVQTMLPLDDEGRVAMLKLVQQLVTEVYVKVAWTSRLEGGRFRGKAPAELSEEELALVRDQLCNQN